MNGNSKPAIALGLPEDYEPFPASVTVDGAPYWLVRQGEDGFTLHSALCPHAGGEIIAYDNIFFCPLHYWTFDQKDGVCQNVLGERLMHRLVEFREDGRLYVVGENF